MFALGHARSTDSQMLFNFADRIDGLTLAATTTTTTTNTGKQHKEMMSNNGGE
jgi:hypothetical protein